MPRGGKRPGAGRKKRIPALSVEQKAKSVALNLEPSQFLKRAYQTGEVHGERLTTSQILAAAKEAAPYLEPKVATVTHTGTIYHAPVNDLELATYICDLAEATVQQMVTARQELRTIDHEKLMSVAIDDYLARLAAIPVTAGEVPPEPPTESNVLEFPVGAAFSTGGDGQNG